MSSHVATLRSEESAARRPVERPVLRLRLAPLLVALVCIAMVVATVASAQPDISIPTIIG